MSKESTDVGGKMEFILQENHSSVVRSGGLGILHGSWFWMIKTHGSLQKAMHPRKRVRSLNFWESFFCVCNSV